MSLSSGRLNRVSLLLGSTAAVGGGGTAILLSGTKAVPEGTAAGVAIGQLSVNEPGTWVITVDPANDAGDRVTVVANELRTTSTAFDYAVAAYHDLRLNATRAADGKSLSQVIRIDVLLSLVSVTMDDISPALDVAEGSVLWNLGAMVAGESRTISPNDGRWVFNADKSQVLRGIAAWSVGDTEVSVTQTHGGATNSPITTTANVTVTETVAYINIGTSSVGTFDIAPGDPLLARQGTPGQVGYLTRAKAGWTTPMYDRVTGSYVVGLTAWHAAPISHALAGDLRGIKQVIVRANNGMDYEPELGIHPIYGNECYLIHVRASDMPSSGMLELIGVVIPYAGLPFVLQGQPDARTISVVASTGVVLNRINHTYDMWSMLLSVDKTGEDLPSAVVYKAADSDPAGNDLNNGLTAGSPLKTWEAVIAKVESIHGTADVGGAIAYLLASQDHEFGLVSPSTITLAANSWLRIMPAPGLTKADVKIARKIGARGLYCERVSVENVQSSVTLENYNPDGVAANNYMHMRVVGVSHDGGAGLDAFGQPNGPQFVQAANGHLQAINCTVSNCFATGFNCLTLDIGCTTDNLSENRDMSINPKVSIRFKVKNQVDLSGGNHCDAMQFTLSRRMHIVEDLDANEGNYGAGLFQDVEPNEDFAYIRPRVNVGASASPSIGINGKPKGYLIIDPICTGGTQIWPATPPYAVDCRMILTFNSVAGNLASMYRYGFSVIGPGDTVDPNVSPPAENEFVTLFGANTVDVVNAAEPTTLTVDGSNFVTQWRCDMSGGGPGPYAVPAAPNRPTFNAAGFNGHPTVDCAAGVSALGRGSTPDSIEGANPCEIFIYGRHDELPASTATRTLFSYGGAASASSRFVRRTVVGGVNKASFLIGSSSLVAPGDFSGDFILHVYYDGALGYGIGLYTAQQPNGLYTTGVLGAAPATGGLRAVMGGDFNDTQGVPTSRWGGGFAGRVIIDRVLTSDERLAAIAVIRSMAGF